MLTWTWKGRAARSLLAVRWILAAPQTLFAYGNSISAEGGALVRLGGLALFDSDDDLTVDGNSSMEIGSAGAASTANVPASTPVWLAVTVNVIGPVQARIEHLALLAGF